MRSLGRTLRRSAILVGIAAIFAVVTASAGAAPLAYLANPGDETVSTFDTGTFRIVGEPIPVGAAPGAIAVTPDGAFAYVANEAGDSVSVIDTAAATVIRTIPVGDGPDGVAVAPDGRLVYVCLAGEEAVALFSTATNALVGELAVQGAPAPPAVTPDGQLVYVPRRSGGEGAIEVFSAATREPVGSIAVPAGSHDLVFTPDGSEAYLIAEPPGGAEVWVIDTDLRRVVKKLPVGATPQAIAVSPDGGRAYVALDADESVAAIDTATNELNGTIPVGIPATAIAIAPDGETAYVDGPAGGEVVAIDLPAGRRLPTPLATTTTPGAIVVAPDRSPTAAFTAPSATATLPAAFSGSASSDPDGIVTAWEWSFGDGALASGATVRHAFRTADTYATRLSVVDDEGCGEATVYTGQTAYCSGNLGAAVVHPVTVAALASPRPPPPPGVCPGAPRIGRALHNRRNGTVRLQVKVPAPGALYLFGKKVHAVTRRSVRPGSTFLTLHARVEVNKRLKRTHRTGVRYRLTFYPGAGCTPVTVHRSVALLRAPKKKR